MGGPKQRFLNHNEGFERKSAVRAQVVSFRGGSRAPGELGTSETSKKKIKTKNKIGIQPQPTMDDAWFRA